MGSDAEGPATEGIGADGSAADLGMRSRGWRYRDWISGGALLLTVLAAGAVVVLSADGNHREVSGAAGRWAEVAASSPPPSPVPSSPSPVEDIGLTRFQQLAHGMTGVLGRVAPGATYEGEFVGLLGGTPGYQVASVLWADGRRGTVTVQAGRGRPELGCAGYAAKACRLRTGPAGETIRVTQRASDSLRSGYVQICGVVVAPGRR
jgi:hypothetical protein